MTALVVRPADHADLPRLLDLYVHLNPDDARCSPEDAAAILEHLLRYQGSVVLVGVIEDTLVTTCTLIVIPNLTRGGKPYALIENVVTHADHRGSGFGRTVLRAAVERTWEAECYKVMLMTGSERPSTLAFYTLAAGRRWDGPRRPPAQREAHDRTRPGPRDTPIHLAPFMTRVRRSATPGPHGCSMNRDTLILLKPAFLDPAYPGTRFYCWHCALLEGVLQSFPDLAARLDVERIAWPRPRCEVVARLGEGHQSLPVLILGEGSDTSGATGHANGRSFVEGKDAILAALSARYGIPVPHP